MIVSITTMGCNPNNNTIGEIYMSWLTLKTWNTGETLFEGEFASWKECLESAITAGVSLDHLQLENADLSAANLDGASLDYARITHCNLRGANLSEASLIKSQWTGCDFTEACLMDTQAVNAKFTQCRMGQMDVAYADLRGAMIDCPAFLKNDFTRSTHMGGAVFMTHGSVYSISRGPVFVRGMALDVVLMDEHVLIGGDMIVRNDQLGRINPVLMDLAPCGHDTVPAEKMLELLWDALRRHAPLAG